MDDIQRRQSDLLKRAFSEASDCSEYIIRHIRDGAERTALLKQVEDTVIGYCLLDARINKRGPIINQMQQEDQQRRAQNAAQGDDAEEAPLVVEPVQVNHKEVYEERMGNAMGQVNVKNHAFFKNYNDRVSSLAKSAAQAEAPADGQDDDDEELVMTEASESYIDPITKKTIVDPVVSKKCKHQFSKTPITEMINNNRKKCIKCPYMACGNTICLDDLEEDLALATKLRRLELSGKT